MLCYVAWALGQAARRLNGASRGFWAVHLVGPNSGISFWAVYRPRAGIFALFPARPRAGGGSARFEVRPWRKNEGTSGENNPKRNSCEKRLVHMGPLPVYVSFFLIAIRKQERIIPRAFLTAARAGRRCPLYLLNQREKRKFQPILFFRHRPSKVLSLRWVIVLCRRPTRGKRGE